MSEPISKEDFIKYSVSIGYCARKTAEKYAEGKEEFTDDDYIEVYRLAQKIERRGSDGLHPVKQQKHGNSTMDMRGKNEELYR